MRFAHVVLWAWMSVGAVHAEGLSIAGGMDLKHDDYPFPYAEVRQSHGDYSIFLGIDGSSNLRAGADYRLFGHGIVNYHLGVVAAEPDDEVGTLLRYAVRISWDYTRDWNVELLHESNCASVCRVLPGFSVFPKGPRDKPNSGQNFLVLRYKF